MKKVIVITGASSGMGYISAKKLVGEGYIVYGLAPGVEQIKETGAKAIYLDLTNSNSIKSAVGEIYKTKGRIDVLYNNAGYAAYGAIEDVSMEQARKQFDVNLFGLAEITKEVLPIMREQKSGLIINTSSMGGKIYTPLGAWYHATKHAVEGFSDCLRIEAANYNIKVVILGPGSIETNLTNVARDNLVNSATESAYENMREGFYNMLDRELIKGSKPELIANTVSKIINKKNPKTRYLVGSMAKPMVYTLRIMGDRFVDWMWKFMYKY